MKEPLPNIAVPIDNCVCNDDERAKRNLRPEIYERLQVLNERERNAIRESQNA